MSTNNPNNIKSNLLTLTKYVSKMLSETRDIHKYMIDNPCDNKIIKEIEYNPTEFVEENFSGITREELSERMGISSETLKKKLLHHDRPITRDFIIALCSQLQLGFRNTNYALKIAGHPLLYGGDKFQKNSRDQLLIDILQQCSARYMSLNEINKKLIEYNEIPIDIKNGKFNVSKLPYTVLDTDVKVISYDESIYNLYNSLETLYDITFYPIKAEAILKNNLTENILKLELYNNAATLFNDTYGILNYFKNYRDFEEYSDVLNDLNKMIKEKRKEIFLQLDDSKNYNNRKSARYVDSNIQIFLEAFNFIIPERNEYFFVDYFEHGFHFYISKRSQFMYYQSENTFNKYIRKYNPLIEHEFNSIEEIKSYYKENPSSAITSYFDDKVISTFENLYHEVSDLLLKIKQNTIFIRNPNIYEGPNLYYDMCCFFKIENKFEFIAKENSDYHESIYQNNKNCMEIIFSNSIIKIDLKDIYYAFIYGLNTIEDICSIKSKYQTFENWINSL